MSFYRTVVSVVQPMLLANYRDVIVPPHHTIVSAQVSPTSKRLPNLTLILQDNLIPQIPLLALPSIT